MSLDDFYERRRINLRQLIDDRFDGVVLRFAESLGMKPPQVHRWLTQTAASRHNITEGSARDIECRVGLPSGWLDRTEHAPRDLAATDAERALLAAYRLISDEERASFLTIVQSLRSAHDLRAAITNQHDERPPPIRSVTDL